MVTTTANMVNRGPRCQKCGEYVKIARQDHNGQLICPDCEPGILDLIRPAAAPSREELALEDARR